MSGCPLGRAGAMRQVTFQTTNVLDFLNQISRCRIVCTPSSSESSKTIRQGIRMWTKNNTANESQTAVWRFFHWNTLYSSHKYKKGGTKNITKSLLVWSVYMYASGGSRSEGPKKNFFGDPPPHYLRVWMTALSPSPPPIWRSGSSTVCL